MLWKRLLVLRSLFLCCGGSFRATKAYQYLNEKYDLTVWDKIRPNPRFEDMVSAAELLNRITVIL